MIGSILWIQSALNFFLNRNLIPYVCSQIFELFHRFEGTITSFMWWLRPAMWSWGMTVYLVLSASTCSTFSLPSGLHPTQLSVCNSKVLSPSPGNCRKLPIINDISYIMVNSAMSDWSRCFPEWVSHFKFHIIWSAGTVVSWGMKPLGNSSSLKKDWCREVQTRVCVRNHSEAMVFRFCVPHILLLSEQRCSTPQV